MTDHAEVVREALEPFADPFKVQGARNALDALVAERDRLRAVEKAARELVEWFPDGTVLTRQPNWQVSWNRLVADLRTALSASPTEGER